MAWKRFVVEWVISRSRSSVVRLVVVLVVGVVLLALCDHVVVTRVLKSAGHYLVIILEESF